MQIGGRFPKWEAIADFVEVCHIDFDSACSGFPFFERCDAFATRVEHYGVAIVLYTIRVGADGIYGADVRLVFHSARNSESIPCLDAVFRPVGSVDEYVVFVAREVATPNREAEVETDEYAEFNAFVFDVEEFVARGEMFLFVANE